jgi:transcriptional regulator with XRE-family HTH domain
MSKSAKTPLATERVARGLTQEQFARLLGVARSTLSSVENGHVQAWPRLRADAAQLLGITSEVLFAVPAEDGAHD